LIFERAAGAATPARKDTPMLRVVGDESTREELGSTLGEICREGARRMLAAALELEVDEYITALAD
jgi:putative transposase